MNWQAHLADSLNAAKPGERRAIIAEFGALTGKSPQSLYRIAGDNGYKSGRKKRADAGLSALTTQQIDAVFALIHQSGRDRKGAIMPVEKALIIAGDSGIIEPGSISVSRMQTLLREREMNAKALKSSEPHVLMKSLHPNHVHEVDASICIQYYLKHGSKLQILDQRQFYKNKPENFGKIKRKIIRWTLTDHYSGSIFVKYYQSDGEKALDLFDFLISAWEAKSDGRLPFRGVPQLLMMDAGSANKSRAIVEWLRLLDVEVPKGNPETPTRDGSVEKAQDIVERWFESGLRFEPATSIEQLNEWALDWCVWHNASRTHSRHGQNRTACWMKIRPEQLRELPARAVLQDLFAQPEQERTVTPQYAISFGSESYSLRHVAELAPGDKVKVKVRPFDLPALTAIWRDVEYAVMPIALDEAGFPLDAPVIGRDYKALPETATQKAVKRSDNLAYGEDRKPGARPFAGELEVMGNQASKVKAAYLPRRGTEHHLSRTEVAARQVPVIDVIRRIAAEVGSVSPVLNRSIKAIYGASISTSEADRIVAEIIRTGGFTPPAPEQLTVAGGAAC